jgi:hypothetical protein
VGTGTLSAHPPLPSCSTSTRARQPILRDGRCRRHDHRHTHRRCPRFLNTRNDVRSRSGASPRPADGPHLSAPAASAEELVGAVGLEAGDAEAGGHVEALQDFSRFGIDPAQVAFVAVPGGVPELSVDPGDAGDEAVGFDGAENCSCLRIDLMNFRLFSWLFLEEGGKRKEEGGKRKEAAAALGLVSDRRGCGWGGVGADRVGCLGARRLRPRALHSSFARSPYGVRRP